MDKGSKKPDAGRRSSKETLLMVKKKVSQGRKESAQIEELAEEFIGIKK
jgi:hypothetical protein